MINGPFALTCRAVVKAAPARAPTTPEKATEPDRPDPLPEGPVVIRGIYPAGDNDAPVRSRIETRRSLFCVGGSDAP